MEAVGLRLRDVRIEVRDWISAIAFIREAVGIGIMPKSTLPEKRKGLRMVQIDPPLSRCLG